MHFSIFQVYFVFGIFQYSTSRPRNSVIDLECQSNNFLFFGSQRSLYGWPSNQIKVGNCTLDEEYKLNATYPSCNIRPNIKGDFLIYTFEIKSQINPNAIITRRRPFIYTFNCLVKRKAQIKANPVETSSVSDSLDEDTTSVSLIRKYLQRQDAEGNVLSEGNDFLIHPGDDVEILVTGDNLWELGLEVYATDCYLKPLDGVDKKLMKFLIKNSCPVNDDISINMYPSGQFIHYTGFKDLPKNSLPFYFHCDLVVCRWDEQCSICGNS